MNKGLTCDFVPGQADTPIFFMEGQPAQGAMSTMSRALVRMSAADAHTYLANLGGGSDAEFEDEEVGCCGAGVYVCE